MKNKKKMTVEKFIYQLLTMVNNVDGGIYGNIAQDGSVTGLWDNVFYDAQGTIRGSRDGGGGGGGCFLGTASALW